MFKFIHAADIHLDSPLSGLEQYEGAPVQTIREASRRALERLVQLAIDERAAFVLIAGDVYDGDWKDFSTGLFFAGQMSKLRDAGIRLFLIAGNHDAKNTMTRSLTLPDNVTRFADDAAQSVTLDDLGAAIHGQSFANRAVQENLAQRYPAANRGLFNIGLLHTSATGNSQHETYAPCSLDDLRSKEYGYWALGHVHTRQSLCNDSPIVFSGNIQGRHIREAGPKGCYLVTVNDKHEATPEFRPLDVLRWARLDVDLTTASQFDDVLGIMRNQFEKLTAAGDGLPQAVRVELTGMTAAHRAIAANREHFINELRAVAIDSAGGDLWIEKVKIHTREPSAQAERAAMSDGAIGELLAVFDEFSTDRDKVAQDAGLAEILAKLPHELKASLPLDDPEWLTEILEGARSCLLSQLSATPKE